MRPMGTRYFVRPASACPGNQLEETKMAIESIGAIVDNPAAIRNAGLGQEDFLKVLLTQLSFQDPLKPLDNQEFIAQMAQFTNLELTRQQNDRVESLLTIQSATQAIGLI